MSETRPTRSRRFFMGFALIAAALLAAGLALTPGAAAPFGTAFSVRHEGRGDRLYQIDLQTAVAVPIGLVGFADVDGLTFAPDGTLFGVDDATDTLITINLATGAGTAVGPLGVDIEDAGLTFGPGDRLFMTAFDVVAAADSLFEINPSTGGATPIGVLDQPVTGLAFDPNNGILFGLGGGFTNDLVMVDPVTGVSAVVGPLINELVSQGGLDFDLASGQLFGIHDGNNGDPAGPASDLFTVSETTGTATPIANVTEAAVEIAGFESLAILSRADLALTKSDAPDPVAVGQPLVYTLQITNNGPDRATGVVLTDTLPAGVTFQSSIPAPTTNVAGTLTFNLPDIASGAGATVSITVIPTAPGTVTNTAVVFADQVDPNTANNTASATTTVQLQADLSLTKTDAPDPLFVGDLLTYTLQVTNNGPNDASGVLLTDTLPAGVQFDSSVPVPTTNAAGTLTFDLGAIANGASKTVTIKVRPTAAGMITNSATVTANETDPNPANNTASAATTVQPRADLSLTKSDAPDPAGVGQPLVYTIQVTNNGPSDATGVVVTDPLPAGVTFASSVPNPTTNAAGTLTFDLGAIANGGSKTITITVTPTAAGTVTNTASVTAAEQDPNAANNAASATTMVQARADLALTKSDTPDPAAVGQPLVYTIQVTNNGPSDATGVLLTDTLPAGVQFDSSVPVPTTNAAGTLTFALGAIANGASKTVTINVRPTAAGTITNSATVTGNETDPNPANNTASATTTVQARADLVLTKSDAPDPATVGQPLVYTSQVTNNGPSDATGVIVTDPLPAGVTFASSVPNPTTNAAGTLTFDLGTIASGGSKTISITVTPTAAGTVTNTASVTAAETDPNTANNADSEDTTVQQPLPAQADLAISKSDSQDPVLVGQALVYTLQVTNIGPDGATGVTVTDTLPGGVTFVSASPAPATHVGGTLTFQLGNIAAGGSRTITVRVTPTQAGTITNTALVAGQQLDPNSNNNSDTESTTVQTPPVECSGQLGVSRTALHFGTVRVGHSKRLRLVITNQSRTQVLRIRITDPADPFSILLGARQYTLVPRQQLFFGVIFAPDSTGKASGELLIESSDCQRPSVTVGLDGTGVRGRRRKK